MTGLFCYLSGVVICFMSDVWLYLVLGRFGNFASLFWGIHESQLCVLRGFRKQTAGELQFKTSSATVASLDQNFIKRCMLLKPEAQYNYVDLIAKFF